MSRAIFLASAGLSLMTLAGCGAFKATDKYLPTDFTTVYSDGTVVSPGADQVAPQSVTFQQPQIQIETLQPQTIVAPPRVVTIQQPAPTIIQQPAPAVIQQQVTSIQPQVGGGRVIAPIFDESGDKTE